MGLNVKVCQSLGFVGEGAVVGPTLPFLVTVDVSIRVVVGIDLDRMPKGELAVLPLNLPLGRVELLDQILQTADLELPEVLRQPTL